MITMTENMSLQDLDKINTNSCHFFLLPCFKAESLVTINYKTMHKVIHLLLSNHYMVHYTLITNVNFLASHDQTLTQHKHNIL